MKAKIDVFILKLVKTSPTDAFWLSHPTPGSGVNAFCVRLLLTCFLLDLLNFLRFCHSAFYPERSRAIYHTNRLPSLASHSVSLQVGRPAPLSPHFRDTRLGICRVAFFRARREHLT